MIHPRPPADPAAAVQPPPHILVLDADVAAGARLARWLQRSGHAVALACSPEQADAALAAKRFHVVVADVDLLGAGGFRWLDDLCRRERRPAVILTPGQLSLQTAARAALLPLAAYLPKPIDHDALRAAIQHAHTRR